MNQLYEDRSAKENLEKVTTLREQSQVSLHHQNRVMQAERLDMRGQLDASRAQETIAAEQMARVLAALETEKQECAKLRARTGVVALQAGRNAATKAAEAERLANQTLTTEVERLQTELEDVTESSNTLQPETQSASVWKL